MEIGIAYRTAERYNDKPVYKMLVDFGHLPNKSSKSVSFGTVIDLPIRVFGMTNRGEIVGGQLITSYNSVAATIGTGKVSGQIPVIIVNATEDLSSYTATIEVHYTRITD